MLSNMGANLFTQKNRELIEALSLAISYSLQLVTSNIFFDEHFSISANIPT